MSGDEGYVQSICNAAVLVSNYHHRGAVDMLNLLWLLAF